LLKNSSMNKIKFNKNDLFLLVIVSILGSAFVNVILGIIGNRAQVYTEYIVEQTAYSNSNKSGEMNMFWALLFVGAFIVFLASIVHFKKNAIKLEQETSAQSGEHWILALLACNIVSFLILGEFQWFLLCGTIIYIFSYFMLKDRAFDGLVLFICVFYGVTAIDIIINLIHPLVFQTELRFLISAVISIIAILCLKKSDHIRRAIIITQFFMPFLLVAFLLNKYSFENEIVAVSPPISGLIIILALIVFLIILNLRKTRERWTNHRSIPLYEIISISTVLSIALFGVFEGVGLFLPEDLHHPGEMIIAYSQIFDMSRVPYASFFHPSGLFSILQGGILKLLGGGATSYAWSMALLRMLFAGTNAFLLSKHLKNTGALLIASVLALSTEYVRTDMMLPTVLILLLPSLISNKNLWLKIWMLLCLVGVIWYPLYGVATFLGTLPFAVFQLIGFIKTIQQKQLLKKPTFYAYWGLALLPVVFSIPLLFRMASYTLVYSSQALLADGISVFGQMPSENFFPYLADSFAAIRKIMYYAARFVIPAVYVWVFVLFGANYLKEYRKNKTTADSTLLLALPFGAIGLIVSYSFSMVRMDTEVLLARTAHLLCSCMAVLLTLIIMKNVKNSTYKYILLGILIGFVSTQMSMPTYSQDTSYYLYQVPDSYSRVSDEELESMPNIGDGFANDTTLSTLTRNKKLCDEFSQYDENLTFFGQDFMVSYVVETARCGQSSVGVMKSLASTMHNIEAVNQEQPVILVSAINTIRQYHFYKWLVQNYDYAYCPEYNVFVPANLQEKIGDSLSFDNSQAQVFATNEAGNVPNSLGRSITQLLETYTKSDVAVYNSSSEAIENAEDGTKTLVYSFVFNQPTYGTDADFLYVRFDIPLAVEDSFAKRILSNFKKSTINIDVSATLSFESELINDTDTMTMNMGTGELLIPIGANINWLLSNHDSFDITIKGLPTDQSISLDEYYFVNVSP